MGLARDCRRVQFGFTRGEVVAASNIIPFPSPDVKTSGELWFACGFIDLNIADRVIVDLGIDVEMQRLPTLVK